MAWPDTFAGSTPRRAPRSARALAALASAVLAAAAAAEPDLLPAEQAFRFSARALDERTLEARFAVADGYYLYRDKLKFGLGADGGGPLPADLPAGKAKDDPFFGRVEIYRGDVVVKVPVAGAAPGQAVVVAADSQGCADLGVCYPVNRQKVTLTLPQPGKGPGPVVEAFPRKKNWFN